MKKPSSKIREEIARLQDQLKQAETREAERIGRIALKAGIGEIAVDETQLQNAFEEVAATCTAVLILSSGNGMGDGVVSLANRH
ncbi:TraC family protein [Phyllobacterium sp. SB3]|uniref:TraC family protein n=1 Tax=Phyllobacterium sp. SB3 TaxID=3156073 RepID=UPI0032AEE17F